jgi:surfactin synthase thioesterase subunit
MTDIRSSAIEIAIALVDQGFVSSPFCFIGHGLGAIFAYEVVDKTS